MPHLIVFALLLGLGAGASDAVAREAVLLPVSCDYRGGRLVVQASQPTAHEIVSERERQVFSACRPGRSDQCRPIMVYRFEVACGTQRVPWVDLATALMATSGIRVWIEGDRLHVRPTRAPRLGACETGDPAHGFMRTCEPWELAGTRQQDWVLPSGFAPVHEVGARFVAYSPAAEPSQDPVPAQSADHELQLPSGSEAAAAEMESPQAAHIGGSAAANEDGGPEPSLPAAGSGHDVSGSAEPPAEDHQSPMSFERIATRSFARDVSEALAAPVHAEASAGEAGAEPVSSVPGWLSISKLMEWPVGSWLSEQFLGALDPLAAMLEAWHFRLEREVMAMLMGVVLLSGLVSGIGWYSARARRARAPAFGAAERQPIVHHFRAPPAGNGPAASSGPAPSDSANQPPVGTALLVPGDEKMCGELCRTAHTMLQQIDARVDDLQGVAPLRRVLQREMRNLEQFLTAVMTVSPKEPEEWRRMRNRLQRIVRELHRLRDIVEGAYRSLSTGGFTSREPPRDKYEAYEALGVNPDVSPRTLKKLVDSLRACWHPDLAKDETDRLTREERMKRINIAWDIITSKRQEA